MKDPEEYYLLQRKLEAPGVIGSNFLDLLKKVCGDSSIDKGSGQSILSNLLSLYSDEHVCS